jgi:uncharacterized repeat protein (TIGR01451 family)
MFKKLGESKTAAALRRSIHGRRKVLALILVLSIIASTGAVLLGVTLASTVTNSSAILGKSEVPFQTNLPDNDGTFSKYLENNKTDTGISIDQNDVKIVLEVNPTEYEVKEVPQLYLAPINLVLVMDMTNSLHYGDYNMGMRDAWERVREAAKNFVNQIYERQRSAENPRINISIVSFVGNATVQLQSFETSDRQYRTWYNAIPGGPWEGVSGDDAPKTSRTFAHASPPTQKEVLETISWLYEFPDTLWGTTNYTNPLQLSRTVMEKMMQQDPKGVPITVFFSDGEPNHADYNVQAAGNNTRGTAPNGDGRDDNGTLNPRGGGANYYAPKLRAYGSTTATFPDWETWLAGGQTEADLPDGWTKTNESIGMLIYRINQILSDEVYGLFAENADGTGQTYYGLWSGAPAWVKNLWTPANGVYSGPHTYVINGNTIKIDEGSRFTIPLTVMEMGTTYDYLTSYMKSTYNRNGKMYYVILDYEGFDPNSPESADSGSKLIGKLVKDSAGNYVNANGLFNGDAPDAIFDAMFQQMKDDNPWMITHSKVRDVNLLEILPQHIADNFTITKIEATLAGETDNNGVTAVRGNGTGASVNVPLNTPLSAAAGIINYGTDNYFSFSRPGELLKITGSGLEEEREVAALKITFHLKFKAAAYSTAVTQPGTQPGVFMNTNEQALLSYKSSATNTLHERLNFPHPQIAYPDHATQLNGNKRLLVRRAGAGADEWITTDTVYEGDTIRYFIDVINEGSNIAKNIFVYDQIPEGLTLDKYSDWTRGNVENGKGTPSAAGNFLYRTINAIPPKQTINDNEDNVVTVSFDCIVNPLPAGTTKAKLISNKAYYNDIPTPDVDIEQPPPELIPHKDSVPTSGTPVHETQTITYTIRVKNDSKSPAHGVVITDMIPAGTVYQAGTGTNDANRVRNQEPAEANFYNLKWTIGTIAANGEVIVSFKVTVGANEGDESRVIENYGIVDGEETNIVIHPQPPGGVTPSKDAQPPAGTPVHENEDITYTIHIKNNSTEPIHSVDVTDAIPSNTTFVRGMRW